MPATLRALLADASLGLRLLTGSDELDRTIGWVHATELTDPTAFLEGGELLLSTGLGLCVRQAGCTAYVERLTDTGVAALGFGTGLSHARVPAALIDAATAAGLPLLEVPRPTPFIAISKAVSRAIAADEYAAVVRTGAGQQALTTAAVGGGFGGLVRKLARLLDAWVVLADAGGVVVHAAPASAKDKLASLQPDIDRLRARRGLAAFTRVLDGDEVVLQVLGSRARGFLALGRHAAMDTSDRHLVNSAASLLTLALEQVAEQDTALRRLRTGLLRLLERGELDLVKAVAGELWGRLPAQPLQVAVIHGAKAARAAAYGLLEEELAAAGEPVFFAEVDGVLAVLVPAEGAAASWLGLLPQRVRALAVGWSAAVGIVSVADARRQAAQAADAARRGGLPSLRFGELAGDRLLDLV
ncbi:MAG: PucR family transcriptional regulator ligand-binding domain-containing protein, partial [Sciscionella sp.]